ncbi:unnamed protein product, partial [Closterium sp. NIES-54]
EPAVAYATSNHASTSLGSPTTSTTASTCPNPRNNVPYRCGDSGCSISGGSSTSARSSSNGSDSGGCSSSRGRGSSRGRSNCGHSSSSDHRSSSNCGYSSSASGSLHRGALSDPASTHNDSGASICFFRDCTDLTPLHTPITFALADPSVGSVVAHRTTILPCSVAPSGFLTGYYTPSFFRNLVGVSHLHDLGFVTTFALDEPVASCTIGATGVPLATFHREPCFGLYSLHTGSHHTGSGLPESLASLPRSPVPPCTPCVEGRHHAASHSSSFPPTTAPFQTLHLDFWGPSLVCGPRQERYFLIVVDDYSRYTTLLPMQRKADVPTVLEPWLLVRGDAQALCGLRLHSDHGVRYDAHQLNLWPSDTWPRVMPRPVPAVSGGAGGAIAEGEGTGAAGAGGVGSGGARGVGMEVTLVEDTASSSRRPHPASPPDFPSVPQFPPRSSLRPVAAEHGGVPAGGTGGPEGVGGGGAGSGGAGV